MLGLVDQPALLEPTSQAEPYPAELDGPGADRENLDKYLQLSGAVLCGPHSSFFVIDTAQQDSVIGVHFKPGGAWLVNAHIAQYLPGGPWNHEPLGSRKLLLHKREIDKLSGRTESKGLTVIPTKIYFRNVRIMELPPGVTSAEQSAPER